MEFSEERTMNERAVIAAMYYSAEYAEKGLALCEPEDFTDAACIRAFHGMQAARNAGNAVDLITVCNAIGNEYAAEQASVAMSEWIGTNFPAYVDAIKKARRFRLLGDAIGKAASMIREGNDTAITTLWEALDGIETIGGSDLQPEGAKFFETFARMGERKMPGISSGFTKLDEYTGGLRPGMYMIVAGRPSMGKSAFAVNVARNVCEAGGVVALFSLEDEADNVRERIYEAKKGKLQAMNLAPDVYQRKIAELARRLGL